jgi:hypothetical protein
MRKCRNVATVILTASALAACGGGGSHAGPVADAGIEGQAGDDDAAAGGSETGSPDSGTRETGGTGDAGTGDGGTPPPPVKCGPALAAPTGSGVILQVDECASRHTISDDIYGITFFWTSLASSALQPTIQFAENVHLPLNRLGGDATTRYNWQVDSTNSGEDWYFMAGNGSATPTPGAGDDALVKQDNMVGASTIITIPIIGYITKSSSTNCSYPSSEYATQDSWNPYVMLSGGVKCGNGKTNNNPIADTHVANHDIPNDPSIQKAWVQHLVSTFGTAASGGVRIYEMDNEPTGWPGVHFDVQPTSPTCQDLIAATQSYASTVKSVDPTALVLGPDDIAPADVFSCMGTTNGQAYLAAMAAYEKAHGTRILDYYSMHYPGWANGGGDQIVNAATHIQTHFGWIAANYPGTKLGYDEYNWGDSTSASTAYPNAVLEVDGLGLFGQAGVDLASFWGLDVTTPTATAFELYRDYDGKGGSFGDVSVAATSSDTTKLHVYAGNRTKDGAVTIVVINKTTSDVPSVMAVSNHTPAGDAAVYLFSSANPTSLVAQAPMKVADPGNVAMTYPANSATLVVIP